MENRVVRLRFWSFVKLMTLGFVCASLLLSPINAVMAFLESANLYAIVFFLLGGPVTALVLGVLVGVFGYPLYRFSTSHFPKLTSVQSDSLDDQGNKIDV